MEHDGVDVDVNSSEDEFMAEYQEDTNRISRTSKSPKRAEAGTSKRTPVKPTTPTAPGSNSGVVLFKRSTYQDYQEQYACNPEFRSFMDDIVNKRVEDKEQDDCEVHNYRAKRGMLMNGRHQASPVAKSPSDSTLYTPALRQGKVDNQIINRISNFVDNIRLETQGSSENSAHKDQSRKETPTPGHDDEGEISGEESSSGELSEDSESSTQQDSEPNYFSRRGETPKKRRSGSRRDSHGRSRSRDRKHNQKQSRGRRRSRTRTKT